MRGRCSLRRPQEDFLCAVVVKGLSLTTCLIDHVDSPTADQLLDGRNRELAETFPRNIESWKSERWCLENTPKALPDRRRAKSQD